MSGAFKDEDCCSDSVTTPLLSGARKSDLGAVAQPRKALRALPSSSAKSSFHTQRLRAGFLASISNIPMAPPVVRESSVAHKFFVLCGSAGVGKTTILENLAGMKLCPPRGTQRCPIRFTLIHRQHQDKICKVNGRVVDPNDVCDTISAHMNDILESRRRHMELSAEKESEKRQVDSCYSAEELSVVIASEDIATSMIIVDLPGLVVLHDHSPKASMLYRMVAAYVRDPLAIPLVVVKGEVAYRQLSDLDLVKVVFEDTSLGNLRYCWQQESIAIMTKFDRVLRDGAEDVQVLFHELNRSNFHRWCVVVSHPPSADGRDERTVEEIRNAERSELLYAEHEFKRIQAQRAPALSPAQVPPATIDDGLHIFGLQNLRAVLSDAQNESTQENLDQLALYFSAKEEEAHDFRIQTENLRTRTQAQCLWCCNIL